MGAVHDDETAGDGLITDAVLTLAAAVLSWLSGLLPVATITLPSAADLSTWMGTYAGPFDKLIPLSEMLTFAVVLLTVWVPSALTYTVVVWVYKHLPFFGRG